MQFKLPDGTAIERVSDVVAKDASASNSFEFVLSDETVDRVGDVIMADGWVLSNFRKNPIALFGHDGEKVIGTWKNVRVVEKALRGELVMAEPGTSPLVDTIRKLIEQKILRAVSVGFRAHKREPLDPEDKYGAQRFLKQELLEASVVSIPANPNALQIAKSFNLPAATIDAIFAKPGEEDRVLKRQGLLKHGKPAQTHPEKRKAGMSTLSQRIQASQKRITDLRDRLTELANKGEDLNEEELKETDELPGFIEGEQEQLQRLERWEKSLAPRQAVTPPALQGDAVMTVAPPQQGDPPQHRFAMPKKKVEMHDYLYRSIATCVKAFSDQLPVEHVMRQMYGQDEALGVILKAAVSPAQTTVAGWAAELVSTANAAFMDRLLANSIYSPLAAMGARYDLGRNGSIKIPTRTTASKAAGAWVGEGAPKPVKKLSLSSITLTPHKLAVISTFTEEMALYSTPAIEALLRQAMDDDTAESLDTFLIDNVAASATRPAGLINGLSTLTPSAATPATAAMIADLKNLVSTIVAAGGGRSIAILMNPAQSMSLGFAQTTTGDFLFESTDAAGNKFNARIVVSRTIAAGTVIAVDAADFATVTGDTPRFAVSNEATLHEEDTSPAPIGSTGTPNVVAAPVRSLFQTDSVAVRLSLYVTWAMRRTGMVAFMTGITAW